MGDQVVQTLPSMAAKLASGVPSAAEDEQVVFYDLAGYGMVHYSMHVARLLHQLPLVSLLAMPYFLVWA